MQRFFNRVQPIVLTILCIANLSAQNLVDGQTKPVAAVTELTLSSKILGADKKLHLYLPESFASASADHTYPVIVVLEKQFAAMIAGTTGYLAAANCMPEAIVVSFVNDRDPFYAPRIFTNGSASWPRSLKQLPFNQPQDHLHHFFDQELFPYLKHHYRAADYRILIGTSARATLVLDSFCRHPALFNVHVAVAAGDLLGMGYRAGETFIDHITEQLKTMANPPQTRGALYIASAESDAEDAPEISRNLNTLAQRLAEFDHPNRPLTAKLFPNEHPDAILPAVWLEVLSLVFPRDRFTQPYDALEAKPGNALAHIDAYYAELSRAYGFAILPRAEVRNSSRSLYGTGRRLMRAQRFAEAAQVFERCAGYRPQSPRLKSLQAEALAALGRQNGALTAHREALTRARRFSPDQVPRYQRQLTKAEKQPTKP